jgi:hypothetical protein
VRLWHGRTAVDDVLGHGHGRAHPERHRFWRRSSVDSPLAGTRGASGADLGGAGRVLRLVWPVERRRRQNASSAVSCCTVASSPCQRASHRQRPCLGPTCPSSSSPCPSEPQTPTQQRSDLPVEPVPDSTGAPRASRRHQPSSAPSSPSPNRSSRWELALRSQHPRRLKDHLRGPRCGWRRPWRRHSSRSSAWPRGSSSGAAPQIRVRRTPSVSGASCVSRGIPCSDGFACQVHRRVRWSPGQANPRTARGHIGFERCSRTDSDRRAHRAPHRRSLRTGTTGRPGAQAAIADANTNDIVPGVRFTLDAHDDQGNPSGWADRPRPRCPPRRRRNHRAHDRRRGAGVASRRGSGRDLPRLDRAGDDTWQRRSGTKRPWPGFFRVTTPTRSRPDPGLVRLRRDGHFRVATLSETDWYGTTVVNTFAGASWPWGQVSTTLTLPKVTTDYSDAVARIKDRAQAVVFGGCHRRASNCGGRR